MENVRIANILLLLTLSFSFLAAQSDNSAASADPPERWNLYYQATSVGQNHGTFNSPYQGAFSFQPYPERDVSLTTTLFFGLHLGQNTQLVFGPEIGGRRGLSNANGLPNPPNGELPRMQPRRQNRMSLGS